MSDSVDQLLEIPLAELLAPLVQAEVKRQLDEREAVVQADYRRWWTIKDVQSRYGINPSWLSDRVLNKSKFQRQLDGFAANYGGRIGWRFEPTKFSQFMCEQFRDIARESVKTRY